MQSAIPFVRLATAAKAFRDNGPVLLIAVASENHFCTHNNDSVGVIGPNLVMGL